MKIVIACESSSMCLKKSITSHLINLGHELTDVGQQNENDNILYYDVATNLAKAMQSGEFDKGIVICSTGAGVSMIVNKFSGIYCVACESVFTAEKISHINNANVLAMGSRLIGYNMGCEMSEKFVNGKWCDGFNSERKKNNERGFEELQRIERENF